MKGLIEQEVFQPVRVAEGMHIAWVFILRPTQWLDFCFPELNGDQKLSGSFSAQRERGNSSAIASGLFVFLPTSYVLSGSLIIKLCSNP